MKLKNVFLTVIPLVLLILVACGTNTSLTVPDVTDSIGIAFGTDETFDIVTWNVQNFPQNLTETPHLLKTLLVNLKVECIAIQEVDNVYEFNMMVNQMPGWSFRNSGSGDTQTAIIYNTATVQVDSAAAIFTNNSTPFPRPPLLMKIRWQGQEIIIISLHLKAYGDDYINESNPNDEEVRRRYACQLLDQYILSNFPTSKVIVLGDMNDQIQEPATTNVFMSFLNKPDEYAFSDMSIAQNITSQNASYPYSSHIDHILITNELFEAFNRTGQYVKTILAENYIAGGLTNYKKYISDHRPVGARFKFSVAQ